MSNVTDNFGGRKFVAFVISMAVICFLTVVMYLMKWLTADYCMRIMGTVVMIAGIFTGGNMAEKYFNNKKGGEKNGNGN